MEMQSTDVYYKIFRAYFATIKDKINFDVEKRKYRFIINKGGSRSSKTYSALQFFVYILMKRKNLKITVWRKEKVTCKATCMEDFNDILLSVPGLSKFFTHNKTNGSFTCKRTGSFIIFEGGDNPAKVHGLKQHISFFNEVSEFPEPVYKQIAQRTSETIFFDYNPSEEFWIEPYKNNERAIFIHSSYKDNAFCPEEIVLQLEGYLPWHPDDLDLPKDQRRDHPENVKNGTADEYNYMVYCLGVGAEKPGKIYSGWKQIAYKEFRRLPYQSYLGMDFGSSNPTTNVEVKFDGKKTFYLHEKMYTPLNDIKKGVVDAVRSHNQDIDDLNSTLIVCDSAVQDYIDELTKGGLTADGADKGDGSVLFGINLLKTYNIVYTVESENLKNEYDLYSWLADKFGNFTDAPVKKNDHLMDAIRYIITYIHKYLI